MPILDITNPVQAELLDLGGVHLFHFSMSSCSQRVCFTLAEKEIPWTSHHIDLGKNEHLTAEYQALNPNGYLPTLIDDDTILVESIDIIQYLEAHFGGSLLLPDKKNKESDQEEIKYWLKRADDVQNAS